MLQNQQTQNNTTRRQGPTIGSVTAGEFIITRISSIIRADHWKKVMSMRVELVVKGASATIHIAPEDLTTFERFKRAAIAKGIFLASKALAESHWKDRQRKWDEMVTRACRTPVDGWAEPAS